MSLSMYDISVPVLVRNLENLSVILAKGEAYARDNDVNEKDLIEARLAEDMFPLTRQVQIACDTAKAAGARLSGVDAPVMEDTEASFGELQSRIANTIGFLKTVDGAKMDGAESKTVAFSNKGGDYSFSGRDYLFGYAYPNFFFHVTTAYDILRHKGVQVGKKDFLGAF